MSKGRQIRVIMFTDIIGFSNIMSKDVSTGIKVLETNSTLHKDIVEKYSGKIIKKIGDGTLCIFDSVVEAINCAQKLIKQSNSIDLYKIRIGVHIGELIFKDDDIFGEGVNIASRLESIAQPDSIIISKDVNDQLLNFKNIHTKSLGCHSIKGIGRVIELFSITPDNSKYGKGYLTEKIIITDKKNEGSQSILVLPLRNKGKNEDEFYCYGMTNELISDLSYKSDLIVNSIENYKIKNWEDLSSLELGDLCSNNYILYGSIWKRDEAFQFSIEFYDIKNQNIAWADHWYEDWNNLPNIIDKIANNICNIFKIGGIRELGVCKTIPAITEAYELYLEGKYIFQHRHNEIDIEKSKEKLSKAINLDNELLQAHMLYSEILICEGKFYESLNSYKKILQQYLTKNDKIRIASCLNSIGDILFYMGRPNSALFYQNKALNICESSNNIRGIGYVLNSLGNIYAYKGELKEAENSLLNSLKIRKILEDKLNIALILGNISLVKLAQLEFETALNRASESLKIREEFDDYYGLGIINNILGNIYFKDGKFNKATHHYYQSLKYKENINDRVGIVVTMNNLGNINIHKSQNNKAIEKFNSSLEISKEIGYYLGTCETLENLANLYSNMGDIKKSHNLIEKSLKIRYEIGCENGIEKTLNKRDLIKLGNKEINIELKSSPIHNNLFPSKGIRISNLREPGKINFSLVNNIIDDINKYVKNYND